jgi:hypothetical protein
VESLVDDNIDLTPSKPRADVSAEKKSAKKKKQEKNSPRGGATPKAKAAASQPLAKSGKTPAKSGDPPAKSGNPPAKGGNPLARFLVKLQPGQTVGEKKGATKAAAEAEGEDDIQIIENDPKKPDEAGGDKMDDSSAVSQVWLYSFWRCGLISRVPDTLTISSGSGSADP